MKYEGKTITLIGNPGDNEVIPFQMVFPGGDIKTVGLRLNETYEVGGLDATGENIIEDWVYERYLSSDYNNKREKTAADRRLELTDAKAGVSHKIGQID